MFTLDYSRERVRSVLGEIDRLKDSDFPHPHSRDALDKLKAFFESDLGVLQSLTPANDPSVATTLCGQSLHGIARCLPLLGFILRSTNVRNSFEVYRPLLQLCRKVLGPDTRLVLSSEWEFSPYVYKTIAELPNYVLIGLPAPESGNPLLVPLAGHELGHSIWAKEKLLTHFMKDLDNSIYDAIQKRGSEYSAHFSGNPSDRTDLFVKNIVAVVLSWSCSQAEESFCDFIGLKIFAESYLHAFAYLLSPGAPGQRSFLYPSRKKRVQNLITAATDFHLTVPANYVDGFTESSGGLSVQQSFLVSLADDALEKIIPRLIEKAGDLIARSGQIERSPEKVEQAVKAFRLLVPAIASLSMSNILNAAWIAYHDQNLWNDLPHLTVKRNSILNELVLKSIEVLDIEEIEAEL